MALIPLFVLLYHLLSAINASKVPLIQECADPNCSVSLSLGKTVLRYIADDPKVLSFAAGEDVEIFSKTPGYFGAQINGKFGFVPRSFVREVKILVKETPFSVPTDGKEKDSIKDESITEPVAASSVIDDYSSLDTLQQIEKLTQAYLQQSSSNVQQFDELSSAMDEVGPSFAASEVPSVTETPALNEEYITASTLLTHSELKSDIELNVEAGESQEAVLPHDTLNIDPYVNSNIVEGTYLADVEDVVGAVTGSKEVPVILEDFSNKLNVNFPEPGYKGADTNPESYAADPFDDLVKEAAEAVVDNLVLEGGNSTSKQLNERVFGINDVKTLSTPVESEVPKYEELKEPDFVTSGEEDLQGEDIEDEADEGEENEDNEMLSAGSLPEPVEDLPESLQPETPATEKPVEDGVDLVTEAEEKGLEAEVSFASIETSSHPTEQNRGEDEVVELVEAPAGHLIEEAPTEHMVEGKGTESDIQPEDSGNGNKEDGFLSKLTSFFSSESQMNEQGVENQQGKSELEHEHLVDIQNSVADEQAVNIGESKSNTVENQGVTDDLDLSKLVEEGMEEHRILNSPGQASTVAVTDSILGSDQASGHTVEMSGAISGGPEFVVDEPSQVSDSHINKDEDDYHPYTADHANSHEDTHDEGQANDHIHSHGHEHEHSHNHGHSHSHGHQQDHGHGHSHNHHHGHSHSHHQSHGHGHSHSYHQGHGHGHSHSHHGHGHSHSHQQDHGNDGRNTDGHSHDHSEDSQSANDHVTENIVAVPAEEEHLDPLISTPENLAAQFSENQALESQSTDSSDSMNYSTIENPHQDVMEENATELPNVAATETQYTVKGDVSAGNVAPDGYCAAEDQLCGSVTSGLSPSRSLLENLESTGEEYIPEEPGMLSDVLLPPRVELVAILTSVGIVVTIFLILSRLVKTCAGRAKLIERVNRIEGDLVRSLEQVSCLQAERSKFEEAKTKLRSQLLKRFAEEAEVLVAEKEKEAAGKEEIQKKFEDAVQISNELGTMQGELLAVQEELLQRKAELENELQLKEEECDQYRKEVTEKREWVSSLELKLSSALEKTSQLEAAEEKCLQLLKEKCDLQLNIQNLQEENSMLQSSIFEKAAEAQSLRAVLKRVESSGGGSLPSGSLDDLMDAARIKAELDSTRDECETLKSQLSALSKENADSKRITEELRTTVEKLDAQLTTATEEKTKAEDSIRILTEFFEKQKKDLAEKLKLYEDTKGNSASIIKKFESELELAKSEVGGLQVQVEMYKKALEEQERSLKAEIKAETQRSVEAQLITKNWQRRCEAALREAADLRRKVTELSALNESASRNVSITGSENDLPHLNGGLDVLPPPPFPFPHMPFPPFPDGMPPIPLDPALMERPTTLGMRSPPFGQPYYEDRGTPNSFRAYSPRSRSPSGSERSEDFRRYRDSYRPESVGRSRDPSPLRDYDRRRRDRTPPRHRM